MHGKRGPESINNPEVADEYPANKGTPIPKLCPHCRSCLMIQEDIISQFGECLVCKYTTLQGA